MIIDSYNPQDTYQLGYSLAVDAKKGSLYCLRGELGVGKTVFTQGFAKGLGIEEYVNSPTFTLVKEYQGRDMTLYHFDLYRILDVEEMFEIGYEEYFYGEGVCLVEWADKIEEILPKERNLILIEKDLEKGFDYRKITCQLVSDTEGGL